MKMTGPYELIETDDDLRIVNIVGSPKELIFEKAKLPDILNKIDCVLSDDFNSGTVFILSKKHDIKIEGTDILHKERRGDTAEARRRELAYAIDIYMQTGELPND